MLFLLMAYKLAARDADRNSLAVLGMNGVDSTPRLAMLT